MYLLDEDIGATDDSIDDSELHLVATLSGISDVSGFSAGNFA